MRVRVIIALTEVNSRHLSAEGRRGGAEIELQEALDHEAQDSSSPDLADRVRFLRHRLEAADAELRTLEVQRARLDRQLSELDGTAPGRAERGTI
jgi:hypothetical protein